jgi:hypothetical protein
VSADLVARDAPALMAAVDVAAPEAADAPAAVAAVANLIFF